MDLALTPEQELRIAALAAARGTDKASVVREMVARGIEYEEWFLAQVNSGIESARQSDPIAHREVVRRIEGRIARG